MSLRDRLFEGSKAQDSIYLGTERQSTESPFLGNKEKRRVCRVGKDTSLAIVEGCLDRDVV